MQKNPALCKAGYLQNDLSMVAKQEVDFELLAAVEASEAEGKMKENEMRIAHRLTSAHEKKSGNRFVDGERDGECLPRSVLYADGKLACVDHDEEKKLIQEQRREIVEHVSFLERRALLSIDYPQSLSPHNAQSRQRHVLRSGTRRRGC